jgi:phosphatidylinositol-bisphosphatase
LTFVNSHLSAFTEQFEKRNQEFHDISRFLSFPYDGNAKSRDPWTPDIRPEVERSFNSLGIYDSHHLIWVGDLNYRVELPKPEAIALVERQEWDLMLRFDQVRLVDCGRVED